MTRILSKNCPIGRVYFVTFLEKFYMPLFSLDARTRNNFIFSLLDIDQDGIIKASDITIF